MVKLKTNIPEFIKNIETKVENFRKMANQVQLKVLKKNLNTTLKTVISKPKKRRI